MATRIRELRKRRGMTLQQLADRVGTTPQTVQRLETGNMTVSMDWLGRFAGAFGIRPADLIAEEGGRSVPLVGRIGRDGVIRAVPDEAPAETIGLDVPADDPVAVHLDAAVGGYAAGSYLIGNRLAGAGLVGAHGKDCIVRLAGGGLMLGRLIWRSGTITLVPLDSSRDVRFDAEIVWAARLVMQIRYL